MLYTVCRTEHLICIKCMKKWLTYCIHQQYHRNPYLTSCNEFHFWITVLWSTSFTSAKYLYTQSSIKYVCMYIWLNCSNTLPQGHLHKQDSLRVFIHRNRNTGKHNFQRKVNIQRIYNIPISLYNRTQYLSSLVDHYRKSYFLKDEQCWTCTVL